MTTTRQAIVQYLTQKGHATAKEISNALHITTANVRHHLGILETEGVLAEVSKRSPTGRGRPAGIYALRHTIGQNNLDILASSLLHQLIHQVPANEQPEIISKLAQAVLEKFIDQKLSPNLSQRLVAAINTLNQMNYRARWEAHADSPHIRLGHCPYAAIIADHPELCRLDSDIIQQLLDTRVEQTAKQVTDPAGLVYCLFWVSR